MITDLVYYTVVRIPEHIRVQARNKGSIPLRVKSPITANVMLHYDWWTIIMGDGLQEEQVLEKLSNGFTYDMSHTRNSIPYDGEGKFIILLSNTDWIDETDQVTTISLPASQLSAVASSSLEGSEGSGNIGLELEETLIYGNAPMTNTDNTEEFDSDDPPVGFVNDGLIWLPWIPLLSDLIAFLSNVTVGSDFVPWWMRWVLFALISLIIASLLS